ncbi:MAG: hypothetical protein ABI579_07455, partial [Candidatus Sumerlaeota bacterium]
MNAGKWKIILCPSGSWGDVHPFIWIGKLLIAQGHEVVALAAEPFESAMQHAGIKTVRTISSTEFEEFTKDPHIWHPREAFKVVIKGFLLSCRPMIDLLKKETVPGNTLLIAGGISFGARILSEAQKIPLITIQLQPTAFINARKPALMAAGVEWLEYLPYPIRRLFFEMIHWKVDTLARPAINALRHEEGLSGNVSHIMGDYWMSPQGVIATFPEWFAQKAEDWPPQTHVTRFPLYDEGDRLECPPELDTFLRAGDAPILFTPGSANCDAKQFFEEAAKTCAILKRRGLFVTRYPSQVPADLPETIQTFAFVPFSHVFPR